MILDVVECIEIEKICKFSIYIFELWNRFVLDGVLYLVDLFCLSIIIKFVRNELLMIKKKIYVVLFEFRIVEIEVCMNFFFD